MSIKARSYEFLVSLKYQIYNSIFLTLDFDTIRRTGIELPVFRDYILEALGRGKTPQEIIESYFAQHSEYKQDVDQHKLLFRFIQYVERQVVLIDALEEAAFDQLNDMEGLGSLYELQSKVRHSNREEALYEKLKDFRIKIVLTAHPTQFYPGYVLGIINDLSNAIAENDLHDIRLLLEQLGQTPFFNQEKPTPYDEATSLGWYLENIFYKAIPKVVGRILKSGKDYDFHNFRLFEVGFWPGGDRDGNPFVSVDTTIQVARRLKFILYKSYYEDVRDLKRRLTFKGMVEEVEELEDSLRSRLFESEKQPPFDLAGFQHKLEGLIARLKKKHNGFYVDRVQELLLKTRIFGNHFASLDIRQDSRIIDKVFEHWLNGRPQPESLEAYFDLEPAGTLSPSEDNVVQDTLDVFKAIATIQEQNGEQACHRFIISNCRRAESVMIIYALATHLGMPQPLSLDIVPLFETINDLLNSQSELERLYTLPAYREHLRRRDNRQYVMLGFSDGTKDGGYFSANYGIFKAKERMTEISRAHDVEVVFFDGRGGPPARGGGNVRKYYAAQGSRVEDKEIQLTIQGQTVSSRFSSVDAAVYYLENLLTAGLENAIFPSEQNDSSTYKDMMDAIAEISLDKYMALKNRPDFMPYLQYRSPLTYFGKTNIGSRPSKRGGGGPLTLDNLRAIPFVGSWSAMKQNVPGYYGLGTALKALMDERGKEAVLQLFQENDFFRSLIGNSKQSLSKTRMELTEYLKVDPEYGALWKDIYDENRLTEAMITELLGMTWEDSLASQPSIELRERIVLPLLVIQQYALMQLEQKSEAEDTSSLHVYENLIIRTLYGIINAARNSA